MSILSILVFMLVQGHVVCDGELFPVSMFKVDSGEHQPIDPQEKDELESLQGSIVAERSAFSLTDEQIGTAIEEMRRDIVVRYGFEKHADDPTWTFQPTFENALTTAVFQETAIKVENFFLAFANMRPNPWEALQRKIDNKVKILYVTAARYLLVTDILRRVSGDKLVACQELKDSNTAITVYWRIPSSGVCFPKPYGSATYKSDYDVGLIGIKSGEVTMGFNKYFQTKFGIPSELVFDTNVYAYTLEFAMPRMFRSDKKFQDFRDEMVQIEVKRRYRMQELASAYFKVYKYNDGFYRNMIATAAEGMKPKKKGDSRQDSVTFNGWIELFSAMDTSDNGAFKRAANQPLADFRLKHNNNYVMYLDSVSYSTQSAVFVSKALLYAAEAYHTRGAIRHVVQALQMHAITECQYFTPLSTFDLWVSMIENWGEANKEYLHCTAQTTVANCLKKMSKYLSRMFNAMRIIRRTRLPKNLRDGLLDFGSVSDPELVINIILLYKKCGQNLPEEVVSFLGGFLTQFGCAATPARAPFQEACLGKIHAKVNAYNKILVENLGKITGLTMAE